MTTPATTPVAGAIGIRELADATGLSMDALRWYEREGLLPDVERTTGGQRSYGPAAVRFVRLVQVLRRTGMPIASVRAFVQAGRGELAAHPRRKALLEQQRDAVADRIASLHQDMAAIQAKIDSYADLIARGIDCEEHIATTPAPPPDLRARHLDRVPDPSASQ